MSNVSDTLNALKLTHEEVLQDYRFAIQSREASLIGRTEVLTGKAKFGIFGDGKEIPQLAMAKVFQKGDFRSGYYRDQTFMFARGILSIQAFFAQLYANTDPQLEPASSGRQMNCHFSTPLVNDDGCWKSLTDLYNSSADVSPTGSQMPRLLGLAYASKLYRELPSLHSQTNFSRQGNEIAFGTIGNASCAEGMFWETVNAAGVLQVPMVLSIWDDEYGISVHNEYQITKKNLSEVLKGFQRTQGESQGYELFTVKGWDYPALVTTYRKASEIARKEHRPVIIHVIELTQPQGHSTSGSHERYKSKERLAWEHDFCCIRKMREWMLAQKISTPDALDTLESQEKKKVEAIQKLAWNDYITPIRQEIKMASTSLTELAQQSTNSDLLMQLKHSLEEKEAPFRKDIFETIAQALLLTRNEKTAARNALIQWKKEYHQLQQKRYSSHLYCETPQSALQVPEVPPMFSKNSQIMTGFNVLNLCFDAALKRDPRIIAFGEDVGQIGDVNQGFAGLQAKHGKYRVSDTGIRECTILGQAIGMAMRGLRPIAEIQYLDYLPYALQIISDDLATVQYRTRGTQKSPVIIRTRGHRLEGIWHSGSPMAGVLHLVRGVYVLVPRNMTVAAGFYNTLLRAEEPAILVEVLNGYRLKETCPDNIDQFTLSLGVPECLKTGKDVTLVTYGACCRIALESAEMLSQVGIDVEVIDVQTLLPFDRLGVIGKSLKKTNRILFLDEDVPGGTTAYMMQEVLERQDGYRFLDSAPKTLSAQPHRPAYGTDGNYWSKPNREDVFEAVYALMHEFNPRQYPSLDS